MPVCMCCPNFISPGVARCENCGEPAGKLFDCPVCGSEVLEGETYCRHCNSYLSKDGTRGADSAWEVSEDRDYDTEFEEDDELEDEQDEEEDIEFS